MSSVTDRLSANLAAVRERIVAAARTSGRPPEAVRLVAATKYVSAEITRAIVAAGCHDLGESRPQTLWAKAESLTALPEVRWHLIGHLQRNKVERTLPVTALIHSVDSLRLAQAIDEAAARQGRPAAILLEVNVSGEPAKHGFTPADLEHQLPAIAALPNLELHGLMAMAGREELDHDPRREFALLRELRERLASRVPAPERFRELSMGMSGDFEQAILEGATLVRVGSALFEGIDA
ncbi:MAG: YggS family pyridoxal phosphate-dependent enzyme [Pirellulales bacterium]